jgi:hypothetical protein
MHNLLSLRGRELRLSAYEESLIVTKTVAQSKYPRMRMEHKGQCIQQQTASVQTSPTYGLHLAMRYLKLQDTLIVW